MSKSSLGILSSAILHPELMVRNLMPPILAGILSIYGFVIPFHVCSVVCGSMEKTAHHVNEVEEKAARSKEDEVRIVLVKHHG